MYYDNKEYGLLTLEPVSKTRQKDAKGRFVKGYTPHNKGKKWDEYFSEETQKKILKNLKHVGGYKNRNTKKVIAITESGKWMVFPSAREFARCQHVIASGVYRCVRQNSTDLYPNEKRTAGTEYKIHGMRLYYEASKVWLDKIK